MLLASANFNCFARSLDPNRACPPLFWISFSIKILHLKFNVRITGIPSGNNIPSINEIEFEKIVGINRKQWIWNVIIDSDTKLVFAYFKFMLSHSKQAQFITCLNLNSKLDYQNCVQ